LRPCDEAPSQSEFPQTVNRANPSFIMDRLPDDVQMAFKHFLKRWHRNPWMRNEAGWRESASIIASVRGQFNGLRIKRILYCAKHGFLCGDHRLCLRCALDKCIEP